MLLFTVNLMIISDYDGGSSATSPEKDRANSTGAREGTAEGLKCLVIQKSKSKSRSHQEPVSNLDSEGVVRNEQDNAWELARLRVQVTHRL
jgi:hypothetical protein